MYLCKNWISMCIHVCGWTSLDATTHEKFPGIQIPQPHSLHHVPLNAAEGNFIAMSKYIWTLNYGSLHLHCYLYLTWYDINTCAHIKLSSCCFRCIFVMYLTSKVLIKSICTWSHGFYCVSGFSIMASHAFLCMQFWCIGMICIFSFHCVSAEVY